MEHSHTSRPGSGRPRCTGIRQDQRIVQAAVAAGITSREKIWALVTPAVSPRTIGEESAYSRTQITCALAMLPHTPQHRQAGYSCVVKESIGECNGTLLLSVVRVGFACMRRPGER